MRPGATSQIHHEAGFTLVEVLAALVVFSIAILGLTRAGAESTRAVSAIEDKMLAGIVADNQIVLARAYDRDLGTRVGEDSALSQDFDYEVVTETTEQQGLLRITVRVSRADQDAVIVERTAFRGAR